MKAAINQPANQSPRRDLDTDARDMERYCRRLLILLMQNPEGLQFDKYGNVNYFAATVWRPVGLDFWQKQVRVIHGANAYEQEQGGK